MASEATDRLRPEIVDDLEQHCHSVLEHWSYDESDDWVASLAVRDGDDHELVDEATVHQEEGLHALARLECPDDLTEYTGAGGTPSEVESFADHVEGVHEWAVLPGRHGTPDGQISLGGPGNRVSLIVRGPDGDLRGETILYPMSGVYVLARVTDEPVDLDEYGVDGEDPPEWAEWIHCDPPLDHMVGGVRCVGCGEETHINRGMPQSKGKRHTDGVFHRPECEHATERDKRYWADKRAAAWIRKRPDPSEMETEAIQAEASELTDYHEVCEPIDEALAERWSAMLAELEERLDPEYPTCPNCGGNLRERGHDRIIECEDCIETVPRETCEAWRQTRRWVWGNADDPGGEPA